VRHRNGAPPSDRRIEWATQRKMRMAARLFGFRDEKIVRGSGGSKKVADDSR